MAITSSIGPTRITVKGPNGPEVIAIGKVTHNGGTAKVYSWDEDRRKYVEYDTVEAAVFADKTTYIELSGTSRTLRREVGLPVSESAISMKIDMKDCPTCR